MTGDNIRIHYFRESKRGHHLKCSDSRAHLIRRKEILQDTCYILQRTLFYLKYISFIWLSFYDGLFLDLFGALRNIPMRNERLHRLICVLFNITNNSSQKCTRRSANCSQQWVYRQHSKVIAGFLKTTCELPYCPFSSKVIYQLSLIDWTL